MQKLLIATSNAGKLNELSSKLSSANIEAHGLTEFPHIREIDESGTTFLENAMLKAAGYAKQTGLLSLADDSGLEVRALDDRPGVLSARYGGTSLGFAARIELLLSELDRTNDPARLARFSCAMAVADASGAILFISEGICGGRISRDPRGSGGFGYDPIFVPDGFDQTFGELPQTIKQEISHRARALEPIISFLARFYRGLT
ncbi:MAG TPA: RdgB/HAM1 family non-canonical purine NTP pyrophosphatase [Pyrinomonadaceae bacterium]|nr:RdgB/HAM1 family non-canonical purine NTP pyrophosphatase [Pyrinomonadaceae bacterium]